MPKSKATPKSTPKAAADGASFEVSLAELEKLVERLEGGEQSLDAAMQDFERGIALTRQCQQSLKEAELRVQQLVQRSGTETLEDFESDSGDR